MDRMSLVAAMVVAGLAAWAGPAAGDSLTPPALNCTALNCSALVLSGRINSHPENPLIASTWVGKIEAVSGTCLRLQVVTQEADLAMTVVAPDGLVFTNDSGGAGGCPTCPRVVVAAPKFGVHTVVIGRSGGTATEASFDLRVGRYSSGNPNCAQPTPGG